MRRGSRYVGVLLTALCCACGSTSTDDLFPSAGASGNGGAATGGTGGAGAGGTSTAGDGGLAGAGSGGGVGGTGMGGIGGLSGSGGAPAGGASGSGGAIVSEGSVRCDMGHCSVADGLACCANSGSASSCVPVSDTDSCDDVYSCDGSGDCPLGQVCCATWTSIIGFGGYDDFQCAESCSGNDTAVDCLGPRDCANGLLCCGALQNDHYTTIACQPVCEDQILCDTAAECPQNYDCVASEILPLGVRRCLPAG